MQKTNWKWILGLGILLMGCVDSKTEMDKGEELASQPNFESDFKEYLSYYLNADDQKVEVDELFKEEYIKPALDHLNDYYQYEDFIALDFTYTDVLYHSDDMIAVTFTLSGDDGWNIHDVDFLITYSLDTEALVDVAMIRSNTIFEGHMNKGYNRNYDLGFEKMTALNQKVAFVLKCDEHISYYNFNEELFTEEEITEMTDQYRSFEYAVMSSGMIEENATY